MFEDILGEREVKNLNEESTGDTRPASFAEVWAAKQRQIEAAMDAEDDLEEEYLQIDATGI